MGKRNMGMKIRVSPTVGGGFERTFEEAWGLETYNPELNEPTVFAGCYGLPDFYTIWQHNGKKYIFWCGSDIRHLQKGYWLDEEGSIKLGFKSISRWLNKNCENWVENEPEREALEELGITAKVCPSYLGDVNEMKPSYKPNGKFYASVSGDDFELYGWYDIYDLAVKHPELEFHMYGNTEPLFITPFLLRRLRKQKNFIVHGRVSKEQMNKEIKDMQGCIRMIPLEGFSEIVAKSVLMEQWPISIIPYPYTILPKDIGKIPKKPNIEGRKYYLKELNNYPWNNEKN